MSIRPMATRKKNNPIALIILTIISVVGACYFIFWQWAKNDDAMMCSVLGASRTETSITVPFKTNCITDIENGVIITPLEDAYKAKIRMMERNRIFEKTK